MVFRLVFILCFSFVVQNIFAQSELEKLTQAIQQEPENAQNYFNRATYFQNKKAFRDALLDLNKALELKYDFSEAFFQRGIVKFVIEDYSGAINDFNRVLFFDKTSAKAYYQRGLIRAKGKDFPGACDDFTKAKALGMIIAETDVQKYCKP